MTPLPLQVNVGIAFRYPIIGGLLAHYVSSIDNYSVTWQANSTEECMRECKRREPRLLVLSNKLPGISASELIGTIREGHPNVRVLLLVDLLTPFFVQQMVDARVHGMVSASSPMTSLQTAIAIVSEGGMYFDPICEAFVNSICPTLPSITPQETRVLRLVADGLPSKLIADRIGISVKTVEKHRERLMRKVGVHDVVHLTRFAWSSGVVDMEPTSVDISEPSTSRDSFTTNLPATRGGHLQDAEATKALTPTVDPPAHHHPARRSRRQPRSSKKVGS